MKQVQKMHKLSQLFMELSVLNVRTFTVIHEFVLQYEEYFSKTVAMSLKFKHAFSCLSSNFNLIS